VFYSPSGTDVGIFFNVEFSSNSMPHFHQICASIESDKPNGWPINDEKKFAGATYAHAANADV
jgi:hypothetical protein